MWLQKSWPDPMELLQTLETRNLTHPTLVHHYLAEKGICLNKFFLDFHLSLFSQENLEKQEKKRIIHILHVYTYLKFDKLPCHTYNFRTFISEGVS